MKWALVLRLAPLIAMTAGALCPQTPVPSGADDPGGWTKAKWGMTQSQIIEAFPGQTGFLNDPSRPKSTTVLGIKSVSIGPAGVYDIRFFFDKNGGLKEVIIEPEGGVVGKGLGPFVAKTNLLGALTDKYGMPHADTPIDKRGDYGLNSVTYQWSWIFPKTIISLSYIDYGSSGPNEMTGITVLGYRLRQTNDAL